MNLTQHIAYSAVISGILYMTFRSFGLACASLISGILIDLDHVIDYISQFSFPFKIKKFFHTVQQDQMPKVRFLFHAWEWLICLTITAWMTDWNPWITGALIGCTQHIILDNINNRAHVKSYSLIWRWKHGFNVKKVFPKNFIKRKRERYN